MATVHELYHRIKEFKPMVEEHPEVKQGNALRIYALSKTFHPSAEKRLTETYEDPIAGTVEMKPMPRDLAERMRNMLGAMGITQVKDVIFAIPKRDDPVQTKHIVIKLPEPPGLEKFSIEVSWTGNEDPDMRIVAEKTLKEYHPEVRMHIEPNSIEIRANSWEEEKIRKIAQEEFQRVLERLLEHNEGKGLPYHVEIHSNVDISEKRPISFSLQGKKRGTRIHAEYNYWKGLNSLEERAKKEKLEEVGQRMVQLMEAAEQAHRSILNRIRSKR